MPKFKANTLNKPQYTNANSVFSEMLERDIMDDKYWKLKNWWRDSRRKKRETRKETKALNEEFKAAKREYREFKKKPKTTEISGLFDKIQSAAAQKTASARTIKERLNDKSNR